MTLNHFTLTSYPHVPAQLQYEGRRVLGWFSPPILLNVLHLDFTSGIVQALPLSQFASGNPTGASVDVPFTLDDGIPFVRGGSLATSSPIALCSARPCHLASALGSFADAHPSEAAIVPESSTRTSIPAGCWARRSLRRQDRKTWIALLSHFRFALGAIGQIDILATNSPMTAWNHLVDAIIGTDYLRWQPR